MDVIKNKTFKVYIQYAIPSVLGMLAISSASIVDGYFVGNYVGAIGLAAINISMPVFSLLFGLALMLAVGSSVVSGKLMAEGNTKSASNIFSKTIITIILLSISVTLILYINMQSIISAFGASNELLELSTTYLSYMLVFIPFLMVGIVLDYFVKIDSKPSLAFFALLLSALINVVLDWYLIVYLEYGIFGAALATGISQLALIVVLLPHFFSKEATIKFVKPIGSWVSILKAGSNGASEFVNEMSVGITIIIFNYIMIKTFGVEGIAAYTVVNYILWISVMISFGISDSLQPIVSKNYGAKEPQRIADFIKYASITVSVVGLIIISFVLLIPERLTEIFLEQKDEKTMKIVLEFMFLIWPVFLFNGINMVISAYFTAIHKPAPSALIALSRSLILPASFILVLPLFMGHSGVYLAIPMAEFFTFIMAIYLFKSRTPKKVIEG